VIASAVRVLVIGALRGMRLLLVPFQGMVSLTPRLCKYEPSCSCYAEHAVRSHGVVRGLGLAGWRVMRCNPWSSGGYDPVPEPADADRAIAR
jgi:putative membrane protein insertion efficiency factor